MCGALLGNLNQFVYDMLGRGPVRIAHAEINDIDRVCSLLGLEFIDDVEDVGWQAFDALKFFHPRLGGLLGRT